MSHDVFISHSSLDKLQADAICHGLEAKGIRCWIAPRDQIAGKAYGEQITAAIEAADVMVLVFSDNVNRSQAVLNEINIAAGADVTIVPFRIASVEFNSELHFYLGRMHWLDAFPQPLDTYMDTLATTVRRNLRHAPPAPPPAPDAGAAAAAAEEMAEEATVVLASTGVAAATAATIEPLPVPPPPPAPPPEAPTVAPPPPKPNYLPLIITGGVVALVVLIAIVALMLQKPTPPVAPPTPFAVNAATAGAAPANGGVAAAQPPVGNGSELTPVNAGNAAGVNYYETVLAPNGPPAQLQGATVISTAQLIAAMRDRDAGTNPFWLVDARGCTTEPTIATSVCLTSNTIQELEAKIPDKTTQIVVFCHDGSCPMSYEMASQAIAAGYTSVFWYRGGINAWMAAGEPSVNQSTPAP